MRLLKLLLSLVLSFCVFKVSADPVVPAPATATSSTRIDDSAKKLTLAKELLQLQDFKGALEGGIKGAERLLSRPQKDPVTQKAFTEAKVKFELQKGKYLSELSDQMEKELISQFNLVELKYLVDILKYPLFKKFKKVMESDKYYSALGKPFKDARDMAEEAKKKLGVKEAQKNPAIFEPSVGPVEKKQ